MFVFLATRAAQVFFQLPEYSDIYVGGGGVLTMLQALGGGPMGSSLKPLGGGRQVGQMDLPPLPSLGGKKPLQPLDDRI